MRRRLALTTLVVVSAVTIGTLAARLVPTAAGAAPRTSLTDIENEVMCVSCREPLAVSQSPQALTERAYIRTLIAQGMTKAEIERALVAQYGEAVLGQPPADGFNLTVYVLPPAIVALGAAFLAITLPRWRRRTRAQAQPAPSRPRLDPADARRLNEDLAREA